jgi:hypothetical protein
MYEICEMCGKLCTGCGRYGMRCARAASIVYREEANVISTGG